jgi:RNA polymerase sigma-70 factor (ECF subfamily)
MMARRRPDSHNAYLLTTLDNDLKSPVASDVPSLLAQVRAGSATALARLLQDYRPFLLLLAAREIPADVRAKAGLSDLVQDTLLAVHQGMPNFVGTSEAEFRAWLRKILVHQGTNLVNHFRHTAKRATGRELSLDDSRMRADLAGQLAAPDPTPSARARHNEEREAISAALARLPQEARAVVLLRHRERLPFADIARRLGKSEAAVRQIWARAVKRLQEGFAPSNASA